jgi:hypothetical protein
MPFPILQGTFFWKGWKRNIAQTVDVSFGAGPWPELRQTRAQHRPYPLRRNLFSDFDQFVIERGLKRPT